MRYLLIAIALTSCVIPAFAADGGAVDAGVAVVSDAAVSDAAVVATAPVEPVDIGAAVSLAKDAYDAAKSGQWWLFSAIVAMLVMFTLRRVGVLAKMGRWKYIVLPVLSLAAAILASLQGGASLFAAASVFTTTWATASLEELWNHGILGKEHASAASKPS